MKNRYINQEAKLIEIMEFMTSGGLKTILVINSSQQLIGVLTDGDVRRAIIDKNDFEQTAIDICNKNPLTLCESNINDKLINTIFNDNDFELVPVIDSNKKVKKILYRHGEKHLYTVNADVFILAGGKGTRMKPFTNVLPKPLLPVGSMTVIERIISTFQAYSMNKFILSLNYKSKLLKSFFKEIEPTYQVNFVYEDNPLGTAGSLKLSKEIISQEDVFVANCDVIFNFDYYELMRSHKENNFDITVVVAEYSSEIPYGVVSVSNDNTVMNMTEKPSSNFKVNTGFYLIKKGVIDLIHENEPIDFPDLIMRCKESGGAIGAFLINSDSWIDTGQWNEYRDALKRMSDG